MVMVGASGVPPTLSKKYGTKGPISLPTLRGSRQLLGGTSSKYVRPIQSAGEPSVGGNVLGGCVPTGGGVGVVSSPSIGSSEQPENESDAASSVRGKVSDFMFQFESGWRRSVTLGAGASVVSAP